MRTSTIGIAPRLRRFLSGRRRRLGQILLAILAAVATIAGYRVWTAWPARLEIRDTASLRPLAFSADGATLAAGGLFEGLTFWDTTGGRKRASWAGPRGAERRALQGAFSPDGRTFAGISIARDSPETGSLSVELIDVSSGRGKASIVARPRILTGNGFSYGMAFAADGRSLRIVAGDAGGEVLDCDTADGHVLARHPISLDRNWHEIAVSPDGRLVAAYALSSSPTSGDPTYVTLWDVDQDREVVRLPAEGGGVEVTAIGFSGDGKTLGIGRADGSIELWDLATNRLRTALRGHQPGFVSRDLGLSHDGSMVASHGILTNPAPTVAYLHLRAKVLARSYLDEGGRPERELLVLDARNGRCLGRAASEFSPVFSRDGRTIAASDISGAVKIRDIPSRP